MSKRNRRKHIKIIECLKEAVVVISHFIDEGKEQEALQLLAECQDSAIALGGHIEKLYGLQTKTVATLEEYCNALYQVSVAIGQCTQPLLAQSIKALSQVTKQIPAIYDKEFPERSEVVFLPYNASMWDSLESVWKAANEDENCDAYVVPIPYYELEENQQIKEFVYEGDKYPENVSVMYYEEYDFELRQPDAIYIHNPYDEWNAVTSVLPEFYSSRIKDYTDKLVYIPYFVLNEIKPDNQRAIENMKHFCYLPGIIYADKVIVQSEDMRQIYINEYMKASLERGIKVTREQLEEKILGLGSPKFDKVANTNKDNLEVPADWLRIIEKPDGTWKKIIFYNTSLAAFLKDGEKMLAKIGDVLRIFYNTKDDVALLWRPHPLMEQTIAAQRPDLLSQYQEIVAEYREAGWGIYDDTSDVDRAVILSDAYYGDMSSVVQVYQETGKPVMVQNVNVESNNREIINLIIGAGTIYKNEFVFTEFRIGGLFKLNLNTGMIQFIKQIQNRLDGFMLYKNAYIEDCNMCLIPWKASQYAKVNLDTYEVEFYSEIDKENEINGEIKRFDKVWKFSQMNDGETALQSRDILTNKIETWDDTKGLALNWTKGMRFLKINDELAVTTNGYLNLFDRKTNRFKYYQLLISSKEIMGWLKTKINNPGNSIINEIYVSLDNYLREIPQVENGCKRIRIYGKIIFEELEYD